MSGALWRADGARIVDPHGADRVLRGVGLGNWLLPEGYMWLFGHDAQSPREIEAAFARLAGEEYARSFWVEFRERFVTERDVRRIAASGFDHVRLPINARMVQAEDGSPLEDGLALIDRLIAQCERAGLGVLLDLHGAPGGQTGTNIDDSPRGRPDLFLEPGYRELTLELWRTLARRYRGRSAVIGYDLLNEPLPHHWQHRFENELRDLYVDLTAAVRAEDPDHLLMYEGSHWATNWNLFTEVWDANSVLQFHKYWSPPDRASIATYLEARDRLGLPIYMGEGGENTPEWLYAVTRLYEAEGIGWNLWPWKKLATHTSPASIVPPPGWGRLAEAVGGRIEIDEAEARDTLDAYLEAIDIDACEWRQDVVDAVFARAPRVLPAWGYGHRGSRESFAPGPAEATARPAGLESMRREDAVAIRFAGRGAENVFEYPGPGDHLHGRMVVDLAPGQWLEFELDGANRAAATWRALDARGRDLGLAVETVDRGLRVSASGDREVSGLWRVVREERS